MKNTLHSDSAQASPFDPDNEHGYQVWRKQKLASHPRRMEDLLVAINDPRKLTADEYQAILQRIRHCNMAIYTCTGLGSPGKEAIQALGRQFGLCRLDHNMGADDDAISSLAVQHDALHRGYIPYTNRPIAWHTDGYYNSPEQQILGMLLHCVHPAATGGANRLLDHEILFLQLRDRNPAYIRALMHPLAMTIPPNIVAGEVLRPARSGPVFSLLPGGQLHMRYTDRSRSIEWRDDALTRQAVAELKDILNSASPYQFEGVLEAGQGLICNNVLHTRSGFEDAGQQRLLFRARYYDRIQGY